jgi:hypothetical protein
LLLTKEKAICMLIISTKKENFIMIHTLEKEITSRRKQVLVCVIVNKENVWFCFTREKKKGNYLQNLNHRLV